MIEFWKTWTRDSLYQNGCWQFGWKYPKYPKIICPSPKVRKKKKKRLHWASVARDYEYLKDTRALDAVHYQCFQPFFPNFFSAFCRKWTPTAACIPRMIRFWIFSFEFPSFCLTYKITCRYSWEHISSNYTNSIANRYLKYYFFSFR